MLIIPVRSAAALYSLHSCHLRYSLINNKNSRLSGAPTGCRAPCRELYKHSPVDSALKTLSPFYRAGRRGSERRRDLPEVNRPVSSSGIKALGPGEAGRAGATPGSAESRGGGAAGGAEGEGGAAAEDGHLKWPLRVQGRFPGEGGFGAAQELRPALLAASAARQTRRQARRNAELRSPGRPRRRILSPGTRARSQPQPRDDRRQRVR